MTKTDDEIISKFKEKFKERFCTEYNCREWALDLLDEVIPIAIQQGRELEREEHPIQWTNEEFSRFRDSMFNMGKVKGRLEGRKELAEEIYEVYPKIIVDAWDREILKKLQEAMK